MWTNIRPEDLSLSGPLPPGSRLAFTLGDRPLVLPLVRTFGEVKEGEPLAYWNSRGRLSLALNRGNAARSYAVKRGDRIAVSIAK